MFLSPDVDLTGTDQCLMLLPALEPVSIRRSDPVLRLSEMLTHWIN